MLMTLRAYYVGYQEKRDLIAMTFIFIMFQRALMIPSSVFFSINSFIIYDNLRDKHSSNDKLLEVESILKCQLVLLILIFIEVLLTSCSVGLNVIYSKVNDEDMPLYELSNKDM